MKIRGVNLGNWLVLEKWMDIHMFDGCPAEDETWLVRDLPHEELERRMKEHRETYITERDFVGLHNMGVNLVRIPVPYFIFGDREPFIGCIEYLDRAFVWAKKHDIKVLVDLHTTPGGQNGYDNGGITGVCKWCKNKDEVEFILTVLERLAERYKDEEALYGIEVLNEPISLPVWLTAESTRSARDKKEAKGSSYVPMKFLEPFYLEAYTRIRRYLPEDKTIVFHDGFRLTSWKHFFTSNDLKNVVLDTHIYIFAMEHFVPIHKPWVYGIYLAIDSWRVKTVSKYVPVVVGEWCISNQYANDEEDPKEQRRRYRQIARMQLPKWNQSAGSIYWSYQLWKDKDVDLDLNWKNSWDFSRCVKRGWMPLEDFRK